MRNKKITLYFVLFLLIIASASAYTYEDADFTFYFEDASTTITNDGTTGLDGTWNTAGYNDTEYLEGTQSGYFSGANYFETNPTTSESNYTNFIYSAYVYLNSRTGSETLFMHQNNVGQKFKIEIRDSDRVSFNGINWWTHSVDVPLNEWVHIVAWTNATDSGLYVNSSTNGIETVNATGTYTFVADDTRPHCIGKDCNNNGDYIDDGLLDCVTYDYGEINDTIINEVFSLGCPSSAGTPPASSSAVSVAINLTFDDESNPWKDYGPYNHTFTNTSGLSWCDRDISKWYGGACNNDSSNNGYLTTTADFNIENEGFGFEFWVKHDSAPSGGVRPGYFWSHTAGDGLSGGEDNQGFNIFWYNSTGSKISNFYSYANPTPDSVWTYYAFSYNSTTCDWTWYQNENVATRSGCLDTNINTSGLAFDILRGKYWGSGADYVLDEFIFYNSSTGLSSDYFLNSYNTKLAGTPPDLDLYIDSVKYALPFNWSTEFNTLTKGGTMPINFTIINAGVINNSNDFNYNMVIEGSSICSGTEQLNTEESITISCDWTTSTGIKNGYIEIDTNNNNSEDVEDNNNLTIYIPFLDKPYFHFNLSEWNDVIVPYANDSSNQVANDDYTWTSYGGCSAFNPGYDGDNVDPYGKYARTCAMSCLVNDYDGYGCSQALVHLEGWSNRTVTSYDNVQNIHELIHVGIAYDIMFPNLTQEQALTWGSRFEDICQQITNLPNTRPDLESTDAINGGNGQGFSSGFAGFCYSILGMDTENPTVMHDYTQQYYGGNLLDSWKNREIGFIRSYKNDTNALYEEGNAYMIYALYHFIDNAYYHQRNGLLDYGPYQNALNSMAREWVTQTLDFTYNGDTIRNDRGRYMRMIQRGDSRSYVHPSDGSILNCAVITLSGLASNEADIKKSILYIRNQTNDVGDCDTVDGFADLYLYGILANQVGNDVPSTVNGLIGALSHDQANDIVTYRTGYSYVNDTVIQIDGGEERMNGHSVASGYYLYALGEPFLDYPQVPYEDDVRAETWTNGISLQNDTQTVEGQYSYYNSACYTAELNQYYGMSDCPAPSFSADYPDYRVLPANLSGEVLGVYGSNDGRFLTTKVTRPYYLSEGITEYFVKIDNYLIKHTIVEGVTQGEGIYHNFLSLNPEFNFTNTGTSFTLQRTGTDKKLDVDVIYTNETITLDENPTTVNVCFGKTDCTSSYRSNQTYRRSYYYTPATSLSLITSNYWYEGTPNKDTAHFTFNGDDAVLVDDDVLIIFDSNDDDSIIYSNFQTDASILVVDVNGTNTFMVSKATWVMEENDTLYNGVEASFIADYNGTNWSDIVPPTISNIFAIVTEPGVNVSWNTNEGSSSKVYYGTTASYGLTSSEDSNLTSHYRFLTSLTSDTLYYYLVESCDEAGNCINSSQGTFTSYDDIAPVISGISVNSCGEDAGTGYCMINYSTDEPATTNVLISGLETGTFENVTLASNFTAYVTEHYGQLFFLDTIPNVTTPIYGGSSLWYYISACDNVTSCSTSAVTELVIPVSLSHPAPPSTVSFTAYELASNNPLTDVAFYINGSLYNGTIYNDTTLEMFNGAYTVIGEVDGYFNVSVDFNVTGPATISLTGFYDTILNVNIKDVITGDLITAGDQYLEVRNSVGYEEFYTFTNGTGVVNISSGAYQFSFLADNYAYDYLNATVNPTNNTINGSLYTNNSIFINVYDSVTGVQLDNYSVSLTGGSNLYADSVPNGTYQLNLTAIDSGIYRLVIEKAGYVNSEYVVTMAQNSYQFLDAYLYNGDETVIFSVVDQANSNPLEDVSVSMFTVLNSTTILLSNKASDITGRVQFGYNTGDYYQFILTADGYDTKTFTLNPILFSTYNILLTQSATPGENTDYSAVIIEIDQEAFYTNQSNPLGIMIYSPDGSLEDYTFNITTALGTATYTGTSAMGESFFYNFTLPVDTESQAVIISYCYDRTLGDQRCFTRNYLVTGSYTSTSFLGQQDNTFGLGLLERIIIATIFAVFVAGLVGAVGGAVAGGALGMIIFGFFTFTGFLPLWAILPSVLVLAVLIFGRTE